MVSGQSFGSGAVTLPCITSMCSVQRFFWWPLSSFSLWIILLPPSLPRFIFKLINQFDRCLVPLAWGLMAGGCRFASYGGVTLSRGWLCQKWKPLDIPGTHLHYVTVVNFVFNCTRTGAPITTGTYQNACWYPIYSVEDDIYHYFMSYLSWSLQFIWFLPGGDFRFSVIEVCSPVRSLVFCPWSFVLLKNAYQKTTLQILS